MDAINHGIGDRFREFIDYKTGKERGAYADLADKLGIHRQRLTILFNGRQFGIKAILAILKEFPELNARWLLLGEGNMLQEDRLKKEEETKESAIKYIAPRIRKIEHFLPEYSFEQLKKIKILVSLIEEELKGKSCG